jgi:hypothetical protein
MPSCPGNTSVAYAKETVDLSGFTEYNIDRAQNRP